MKPRSPATAGCWSSTPAAESEIDPGEVAALAGAGVQEHGRAARDAAADIGATVAAAPIVSAVDGEPGGDSVHPPQAALGESIRLGAAGRLAVERTGQGAVGTPEAI